MLDYKYENRDYYCWIEKAANYAIVKYQAQVNLSEEENSYSYSFRNNRIELVGSTPPRDKLYILLHEIGHVSRMMENSEDPTFFLDKSGEDNVRQKTMTLMEEVLAWHRGESVAKSLQIPIENRAWQRLMNKSIEKYVNWIKE